MTKTHNQVVVPAAGCLVWRRSESGIDVAIVHRARYDDWSWPKGKLDPGETFAQAAAREVLEETGLVVRLGVPLPEIAHRLPNGSTKVVRYWAAQTIGGSGELEHEVDEVRWVSVDEARSILSYPRDLTPLDALLEADAVGELETWPLLLVRHAHAISRSAYDGDSDKKRPLSERGRARARRLAPVLAAWAPTKVVSSDATRCVDTVRPFSEASGVKLTLKRSLSEETFTEAPERAASRLAKSIARARPIVLCTHRPLIPSLVTALRAYTAEGSEAARQLTHVSTRGMDKGEVLACQVVGAGKDARIVSIERLRTPVPER